MKLKSILSISTLLIPLFSFSQESKMIKHKLSTSLTEQYTTAANNNKLKDGIFLVYEDTKKLMLRGVYKNGEKSGTWRYYDGNNHLTQIFDYSKSKLLYTNADSGSYVSSNYYIQGDSSKNINPPVKIGGATFTFLLLHNNKLIPESLLKLKEDIKITYTFDVSEKGKTENVSVVYATSKTEEKGKVALKNADLLDFVPAKKDNRPVRSKFTLTSTIFMDKLVIPGNNNTVTGS